MGVHPGVPGAYLVDRVLRLVRAYERGGAARGQGRAPRDYLLGWVGVRAGVPGAVDHRRDYEPGRLGDGGQRVRTAYGAGTPSAPSTLCSFVY